MGQYKYKSNKSARKLLAKRAIIKATRVGSNASKKEKKSNKTITNLKIKIMLADANRILSRIKKPC